MTVSYYLKRAKSNSETGIYAILFYGGQKIKYYIPEKIQPKFWNKSDQQAKETKHFPEYSEFNQRLRNITSTIMTIYRKYQNDNNNNQPSPDELKVLLDKEVKKKLLKKDNTKTFIGFFEDIIEQSKRGIRLNVMTGKPISQNTIKTYNTTLKHLKEFQEVKRVILDFASFDLEFYKDFTEYLMRSERKGVNGEMVPVNRSTNTIGKNFQVIKLILNEAAERGLNKFTGYKSKRFITVRENSDSIYLNENEISEIENLDLSGKLDRVRDLFIIGCYTGLRWSDYTILKPENIKDGCIEIIQTKTGAPVVVPIHRKVQSIIDKYNGSLPVSISNQKTNKALKEIGKLVPSLKEIITKSITKGGKRAILTHTKWELLTSHTARRSFATNSYLKLNGKNLLSLMSVTGHKTERSFMKYIKITPINHAIILRESWNEVKQLTAV